MSRISSAAVNVVLTNYAQGLAQDAKSLLAEFLCPTVQVTGATGQYKTFDDANAWAAYETARAVGGDGQRIGFNAQDASFNCKPQSLEVTVDKSEREQAGDSPLAVQLLDQAKIKALINATTLSHDKKILDFIAANTTAVDARGNWTNDSVDPIDQLDEQLDNLATAVGSVENIRMAIGVKSWRKLRSHPKVKARCSGVQVGGISLEQLSSILMFPVQIRVGYLGYLSKKTPATGTKTSIIGDNVILTATIPSPTVYDPSGFKCFTTGQGRVDSVMSWTGASGRYDVHAIDWSEDVKVTSTASNIRLAIT